MTTGTRRTVQVPADTRMRFLVILLRRFPRWAIWLPHQGEWTAVRARYGSRPTPHEPLVWVQAASAQQLCEKLRRAERDLRKEARAQARQPGTVSDRS